MIKSLVLILISIFLQGCASKDGNYTKKNPPAALVVETHKGVIEGVPQLEVKKYILTNGLRVLLVPNSKLPTFSLYIHYGVGSKHEVPGITGSSHFLEHMMFKGAKNFGKGSFDRLIEGNGGVSNAYTTNDSTVYHENLPIEALELTLKMEADRMQNLLLDPQEFLAEKDVVLEERKMRYENSPRGQLFIRTMGVLYQGTPYEIPVIGSNEDVKRVTRDEVFNYFKTYYVPNNAVLVIAGDIQEGKTIKFIENAFGAVPKSSEVAKMKLNKEKVESYNSNFKQDRIEMIYGQSENPLFMVSIPSYAYGSKNGYALDILSKLLGEGESSYLEQKYVKSLSPLLSNVSTMNYSQQHTGMFIISGEFLKNASYGWWKKELETDLVKFCESEITEKNLQKAINNSEVAYYANLDQNSGAADQLGAMELFFGDFRKYSDELKIYKNITVADLKTECMALSKRPKYLLGIWKKFDKKIKL